MEQPRTTTGYVTQMNQFNRNEKRRKQREALGAAFKDPLTSFTASTNQELRHFSQELADDAEKLKARIRKTSASSDKEIANFQPGLAKSFIDEREPITEDLANHLKACRTRIREAQSQGVLPLPNAKRLLSGIEDLDAALLQERAALAKNRMKVEYGILSHPTHSRLGEAYLAALVESLSEPSGAKVKKQGKRDKHEHELFKRLVRKAYSPQKGDEGYDAPDTDLHLVWCPVTQAWHESPNVRTAHLVPYAIGEVNAAYIFGLPIEDGWNALWTPHNGIPLYYKVEEAMDKGRLLIVPELDSANNFKVVLLDESLSETSIYLHGPKFGELHNRTLIFKTAFRPGKRYLYFLCLITLFRRHRFVVEGWEKDQQKLQMGRLWGTPGKWMKASIIRALALEIGDICMEATEMEEGDIISQREIASPEKGRKIATEIRQVFEGVENEGENADSEDGDSDDGNIEGGESEGRDA